MIYLSGKVPPAVLGLGRPDFGVMVQPIHTARSEALRDLGAPWAADNGCYAAGNRFDDGRWLTWLATQRRWATTCLFAVAPDVVGDARATLARSAPHFGSIKALGFRPAFVSQDSCASALVPWDEIDCLFVGGTTEWKLSERSYALVVEARERGKWTHMGRVNGFTRIRAGHCSMIDSTDGTLLAFGPRVHLPRVLAWLDWCAAQPALDFDGV